MDNMFVERLWRSLKYEEVYLKAYESVAHARRSIDIYFGYFNEERRHSSLGSAHRTTYSTTANRCPEQHNQHARFHLRPGRVLPDHFCLR